MRKITSIVSFLSFICCSAFSQQYGQSSLFFMNKYKDNPAYAGFDGGLSITGGYRTQWLGIARNPVSQSINAHTALYFLKGSVGISIDNDILGAMSHLRTSLSYNYVKESYVGLWSFGARLGLNQITLDGSLLRTPTGIYEDDLINHNDPILSTNKVKGLAPFLSIGGYFIHDLFEAGIAVENLISSKIDLDGSESDFDIQPTLNIFGEYFFSFSGVLDFHPSIFLKTDFKQSQLEITAQAIYDNYIFGGIGWRGYSRNTFDALILFGGIQLNKKWKVSYAYDIPLSTLSTIARGSHEIILNYNLNKVLGLGLPPKTIFNPRF